VTDWARTTRPVEIIEVLRAVTCRHSAPSQDTAPASAKATPQTPARSLRGHRQASRGSRAWRNKGPGFGSTPEVLRSLLSSRWVNLAFCLTARTGDRVFVSGKGPR
jgi:hypothetical protein